MQKHKKVAEIGDFEIWQAPDGTFEVYSPCARVGVWSTETRAREHIARLTA